MWHMHLLSLVGILGGCKTHYAPCQFAIKVARILYNCAVLKLPAVPSIRIFSTELQFLKTCYRGT